MGQLCIVWDSFGSFNQKTLCVTPKSGETVEKRLDNARNNFERAKTDVFPLEVPNLGVLKRAVIRHDNSGPSPAWYCCNVSIC